MLEILFEGYMVQKRKSGEELGFSRWQLVYFVDFVGKHL